MSRPMLLRLGGVSSERDAGGCRSSRGSCCGNCDRAFDERSPCSAAPARERNYREASMPRPAGFALISPGSALLPVVRSAQRLPGALHDVTKEVVLRVDQAVSHLHRAVDDFLPPGRTLAECRQYLVDGVDELAHRLDRSPLRRLARLERLVGELGGPFDFARLLVLLALCGVALASGRRLASRRAALGLGLWHWDLPPSRDSVPLRLRSRKSTGRHSRLAGSASRPPSRLRP